jgi:hypothetical protein
MTVATLGSAADAWSRRAPFDYKKMVLQLAECSGPAFLMAAATLLVAEARMCEREFGPLDNGAKPDLDKRLAGDLRRRPSSASMRKRTRKRPPTWGSVSATSTGPPSGPLQLAMPSGVMSASNTIDGRALIRRKSVRLVIVSFSSLRLPCFRHRPRADRGSPTRSVRSGAANSLPPSWARAGGVPSRCVRFSTE